MKIWTGKMREKLGRLLDSPAWMFSLALAIRLLAVAFTYQGQLNPRHDHWPFGYETGRIARAIASGRGFSDVLDTGSGPTAWMTPLYPYLAAGVFKLFGIYTASSALVLLSLNSLFSALTCIPIYLMARESFGEKVARWAGWGWTFFPFSISAAAEWIWETCLTTFLLSCLFLLTLRMERTTRLAAWAGFGALWGITSLSNPNVLVLLPFLTGWVCHRLHQRQERCRMQVIVAMLSLVVVVTPWFVRNYRVFHTFIPFRQQIWFVASLGNNPETEHWATEVNEPVNGLGEEQNYRQRGERNFMDERRRETIEYLRNYPGLFVWRSFRRFVLTWTGFWSWPAKGSLAETFDLDLPFDPGVVALCTVLTALAIFGLLRAFSSGLTAAWPYAFMLLVFPSIYYVTLAHLRFRHPIDPEIIVLAAYGCRQWIAKASLRA
jgi:hypothetical protein